MSLNALRSLSMRGRLAIAGVTVAGLGLGLAPLASAAPTSPTNASSVPVIKIASTYQGVPYRWGGTSTHGFDCSGYVQFVFRKLGVNLPRTAEEQYEAVKHITKSQLQVGDLVFYGGRGWVYHVGIYAGNNMFWDAPHTGSSVRLQKIWAGSKVYGRVRGVHVPITSATVTPTPLPVLTPVTAPVAPVTEATATTAPTAPTDSDAPNPSASPTSSVASPSAGPSSSPSASTSSSSSPGPSAGTSSAAAGAVPTH